MTAPTGREQREAAVVESVARALHKEDPTAWACGWPCSRSNHYRRLAAAAVAAYRATQDGGAEEAWGVKPDPEVEAQYRRDIADINQSEGRCVAAYRAMS